MAKIQIPLMIPERSTPIPAAARASAADVKKVLLLTPAVKAEQHISAAAI